MPGMPGVFANAGQISVDNAGRSYCMMIQQWPFESTPRWSSLQAAGNSLVGVTPALESKLPTPVLFLPYSMPPVNLFHLVFAQWWRSILPYSPYFGEIRPGAGLIFGLISPALPEFAWA